MRSTIDDRLDYMATRELAKVDPADREAVIDQAATAIECLIEAARSHTTTDTKDMTRAIRYAERVAQLIYKTAEVDAR
jgi:hypothetical protein